MRTDPNYQELRELHAENNQIVSMHEIEASNFIKNFQVLDIRGNRLTGIETYIYNNAFEFDNNKKVKLAGNKVMCDCNTAQHVENISKTTTKFSVKISMIRWVNKFCL